MNSNLNVDWQPLEGSLSAAGDTPVWHPTEERLYWADPPLKRVWRHHPISGLTEHWDFAEAVTGVMPCRSGGLLIVTGRNIQYSSAWRLTPHTLTTLPESNVPMQLHGGRCDPWGRYWLSAQPVADGMSYPPTAGSLLCLPVRKSSGTPLTVVRDAFSDCHGWSWSLDGRLLAWCATGRGEIEQSGLSLPGSWPPQLGMAMTLSRLTQVSHGRPRGGALDRLGRYWVALEGGGQILCIDTHGHITHTLPTPLRCPLGVCFGGTDYQTLFVTSARAHRPSDELAAHPLSGYVLSMRVDSPGVATSLYWD